MMLFFMYHSDSEKNVIISDSKQKLNAQIMSFTA